MRRASRFGCEWGALIEAISGLLGGAAGLVIIGLIVFAFLGAASAVAVAFGWLVNLFRSEESKRASEIHRQLRRWP
jgi:hypothetical protein